MQLRARDHHRTTPAQPVGVGLHVGPVDDGDGAAADHLHRVVRVHDRAGVLVEPETDQRRRLGDRAQQPPEPRALLEVLVDDRALDEAEPGGRLHVAVPGGRARLPERHHVRGERAGARRRARDHGASVVREMQALVQPGSRHDRGEAQLVPAGEEHARRLGELRGRLGLVGLRTFLRTQAGDARDTELEEQSLVQLECLLTDLRRGRDDRDAGLRTAGELYEALEDLPAAKLVLGAADQHDRARAAEGRREVHTAAALGHRPSLDPTTGQQGRSKTHPGSGRDGSGAIGRTPCSIAVTRVRAESP